MVLHIIVFLAIVVTAIAVVNSVDVDRFRSVLVNVVGLLVVLVKTTFSTIAAM